VKFSRQPKLSRGFTLIELLATLAIIAILGILVVPQVQALLYKGRIEPSGKDISTMMTNLATNAAGGGTTTPYAGSTTANCANAIRGLANALNVAGIGAAATLTHNLGATGATVTCGPGTITTAGDSVRVTVSNVNEVACPGLAAQLKKTMEVIVINSTNVKASGASYAPSAATDACTAGNTNTFTFTFRG